MRPVFPASVLRHTFVRPRRLTPSPSIASAARSASTSTSTGAAQKKAQDAASSLQKNAEKAWEGAKRYLGPVGERAGNMLGSYREPLFYNLTVARELFKQVYIAERLAPPTSFSTLQNAYSTLWSRAISPGYWREIASNGELLRVGIYAVEAYGIFKIGEILGRRSLVGYKLH